MCALYATWLDGSMELASYTTDVKYKPVFKNFKFTPVLKYYYL